MHCELVLPGLFAAAQGERLPAAELLLARGRESSDEPRSLERWLLGRFGVEEDACPAGALTLLAHGAEPGEASWARADPVHLQLMRERMVVVPAEAFGISPEEAGALCATLNAHFAGRLEVRPLEPHRWVARLAQDMALGCDGPLQMAGQDAAPRRAGDVLTNELQMVLHEHPVNQAREARGEPPVNSVWLWGAGRPPARLDSDDAAPCHSVAAAEPLALGLARLCGARGKAVPDSAVAWMERAPEEGRHLAVLDALRVPLALGDADACRKRVHALDEAWLAPLLAALRGGRIGMLTLHVPDAGTSVEAIRSDLRRFWRRARPISRMAT
jgi:hypothetical protein